MWHVRDTRASSCVSLEDGRAPGKEEKGRPAVTQDQHTQQDPTTQYPQPEFGKQEGRAAIITGGDSGIGRAVALAFAREGADVLISYLESEEPDAQETVRAV